MFMVPRGEFAPPLGRPLKYRIHMLAIGESIFLPRVTHTNIKSTILRMQERHMYFQRKNVWRDGVRGLLVTRIAPPKTPRQPHRPPLYPLKDLQVGESLLIPDKKPHMVWRYWSGIPEMKFKSKAVMCRGTINTRVWRIA